MSSRSVITSPKPISNCEHAVYLESSLLQLRDTGFMSDVTIVCGSQTFKAHKIILVASSGYFYNIFTNKLKKDVKHLAMTDITPEILKIILDYIYTGFLNVNRFIKIDQDALIRALHHLEMADVYQHRLRLMMKSLAPNYYSELWSLADLYQMKDMSLEIAKYIAQNLELCMNNRHFVNLTLPQLVAVLSSEYLKTQSESMTLEAIQKWVLHDISTRERYATSLLSVAKVTVSAKTKAIAFYDGELQNFLLAPSRRKSCSPNCKKDKGKRTPMKDIGRSSQVSLSSYRSEKNEKVIRTWKKKPMKLEDAASLSFDYSLQHGDYQIGGESDIGAPAEIAASATSLSHFTSTKIEAERDIEKVEKETQVVSSRNKSNEQSGNGDEKTKSSLVDYSSNNLSSEFVKPRLLPETAVATELMKKFKKPVRVYSIQFDSEPPGDVDAGHEETNQFSEERIQIMKLKSKLNLIINRIRCTLQKNTVSQFPNIPMSEDGSSVCSKHSDGTFTDADFTKVNNTGEDFPTGNYAQCVTNLRNSPGTMKSRMIPNILPIENVSGNFNFNQRHENNENSDVKLSLNLDDPTRGGKTPVSDTFRASEKQNSNINTREIEDTNVRYYHSPQEACNKGSSVVLKRPIATSNESLISPEEVRCRLEKFKRLMHTKCSNPVDVEKINLKGSRSFIISGTEVDPLDAISDHCDFLSDISEVDTVVESNATDDGLLETQTEWFRTLSTIPEETSICDFTGTSSIELRSVKSDSPLKFGEKCKTSWNIKEPRENYGHTIDNPNYLSSLDLNDLDKCSPDICFGYELASDGNSQLFDEDIMQQHQLMINTDSNDYLSNVASNVFSSRQQSLRNSSDSFFTTNEQENAETSDGRSVSMCPQCWDSEKMESAEESSSSGPRFGNNDIFPLCKLKVSDDSDSKSKSHYNCEHTTSNSKSIAAKTENNFTGDYEPFENLSLGELKPNEINSVFEYGGYQCFAERSSNLEEPEAPTARSCDTLNITLENFVTSAHSKMRSMPIANDIWKTWKTKLEASCKPSPRPTVKSTSTSLQTDSKTLSTLTPNVSDSLSADEQVEILDSVSQTENEELRNALQKRIFSMPKNKMAKQTHPNFSHTSGSSPDVSVQVSPMSAVASLIPYSSPELIVEDESIRSAILREESLAVTFPILELPELAKEREVASHTARTQILASFQSRNYANLSACPLQKTPTEKVQYGQAKAESSYQYSTPTTTQSRDRSTLFEDSSYESPTLKTDSVKESRFLSQEGPLLILLATNKHNEASQQVYCLRRRCWLAQRQLLMPPIENNYSVGFFEGNVYYIGGLLNGSFRKTNSVLVYRSREHMLVPASDLLVARVGAGVANLNKKIYVAGGIGRYHKPIAQVERYDTKMDRWHLVAALRIARTNVCLVTSGKLLYAIGGTVSADSVHEVVSKACESYDSEIDQWSLLVELPSHFLMTNPLVTSVDSKLYAVRISKPDVVFRFHTRKNKWLPIQNTKLTASKVCCILPGERKLYAVELAGKTIHSFDMHAFQWEVETHFPVGLHWQAAAFVTGLLDENE